jgi:hypothetical protein
MIDYPVRLLVVGYGFAAGMAAVAFASGVGALAAALGFWLGGAASVLILGAALARRRRNAGAEPTANLVLEEELARWEQDRRADSAEAEQMHGRTDSRTSA